MMLQFYSRLYHRENKMSDCQGACSIASTKSNSTIAIKSISASVEKQSIQTKLSAGKHSFYADETPQWGGIDEYPDPWDYILGGLASCIAITLRQYADSNSIPLEKAEVLLNYYFAEKANQSPYKVTKSIRFVGNLSDEQKKELIRISDSPAQKMLETGLVVETVAAL